MIGNRPLGVVTDPGFLLQVSMGLVKGWSAIRKYGSIGTINSSVPAHCWEYGITPGAELYTFSADNVADIDTVSGDDIGDTADVTIEGLLGNGDELIQTVATDGQNKVSITPLWRFNRMFNSNGDNFAGNIYCYVDGAITGGIPDDKTTVRGYVSIEEGQTLQSVYTVPNGRRGHWAGIESSLTKGIGGTVVAANVKPKTRDFGKVFRTQDEYDLISHGDSIKDYNFPVTLTFQPKTDFVPLVDVTATGVGISFAYSILLEEL